MHNIMIYGLERSGTNYLTQLLLNHFEVQHHLNGVTYPLPHHKHFRPYHPTDFVPTVMQQHNFRYPTFADFNAHVARLTDQADLQYIIISKDPYSWYRSFEKFAAYNKMFYHIFKRHFNSRYLIDYHLFHEQWLAFQAENPGQIQLIQYEALLRDMAGTLDALKAHFGWTQTTDRYTNLDKVPINKKFTARRRKYYLKKDYQESYSPDDLLLFRELISPAVFEGLGYAVQ